MAVDPNVATPLERITIGKQDTEPESVTVLLTCRTDRFLQAEADQNFFLCTKPEICTELLTREGEELRT